MLKMLYTLLKAGFYIGIGFYIFILELERFVQDMENV